MEISIITCTGERTEAFGLCAQWMSRQTYNGNVQWIVVDDGRNPCYHAAYYPNIQRPGWKIEVYRPEPYWQPGQITTHRNLQYAIERATGDIIMIMEDDDYYAPEYISSTITAFGPGYKCVGWGSILYYDVKQRRYFNHYNLAEASLCTTAFIKELIPEFLASLEQDAVVDHAFWGLLDSLPGRQIHVMPHSPYCVGIKGLPGRGHAGHHDDERYNNDPTGKVLRWRIGEDAKVYEPFYNNGGKR